jgi:hypothetical protein
MIARMKWGTLWLLSLLAVVLIGVTFLLRLTERDDAVNMPSHETVPSRIAEPAAGFVPAAVVAPNPAAQKAGPPDPVAQQQAAASADSAAKAAAALAASGSSTN